MRISGPRDNWQAVLQGQERLANAAAHFTPGEGSADPVAGALEALEARHQVSANLKALEVQLELDELHIDLLA